ncbi:MAG: hypothetical protein C0507_11465 [Cyanobacteria bacterium PR.3.49]|nr:hypothetical protein [Cyanobacteria bacterium PR.3.49]
MHKTRKPKGFTESLYRFLPIWFNRQAFDSFVSHLEQNPTSLFSAVSDAERRDYEQEYENQYGSFKRGQIFHFIADKASYDPRWREICATAMKNYEISAEEIIDCFKNRR